MGLELIKIIAEAIGIAVIIPTVMFVAAVTIVQLIG